MTWEPERKVSREETVRLGRELFEQRINPLLKPEDHGKFVVIDVLTGEYEIDAHDYAALDRLYDRVPNPEAYLHRVGYATAYRFRGTRQ